MIDYFQVRTKSFSSLISGHKSANLTIPKQYLLKSKNQRDVKKAMNYFFTL